MPVTDLVLDLYLRKTDRRDGAAPLIVNDVEDVQNWRVWPLGRDVEVSDDDPLRIVLDP
jgi:hypothetical protein